MEVLSALSGVIGVVVAVTALIYGVVQGQRAERAALAERRLQFELRLLAELSRQWALTKTYGHIIGHLRALVRPDFKELHLTRAATGVEPTEHGLELKAAIMEEASGDDADPLSARQGARQAISEGIAREFMEAIQRRLQ